jgi:hypothetical protein
MKYGPAFWRSFGRALSSTFRVALACAILLVCADSATGQVFQLTGGSSSELNAQGGSLEIHAENYSGRLDLGYLNGPSLGFSFSRPFKDNLLSLGDQQIPLVLPTDLFDRSFYFLGRGVSLSRKLTDGKIFVFAGLTSDGYTAPFLNIARTDTAAAAVFYERELSPSLRFISRNIFSQRQTSIQSLQWQARKDIQVALSAGLGNNQPYWATSFMIDKRWIALDASYAGAGDKFRRVLVATPELAENDRENIRLELKPSSNMRVIVSRNNYLSSFAPNSVERAMVQGIGAGVAFGALSLNGSYFKSYTQAGNSNALSLGIRRTFTKHFEAGTDFLQGQYGETAPARSVSANFREILNSRFSLTQIVTRNNGQTNVAYGGAFLSNLVSVSVDYQTVFLPFVQTGQGQIKQVIVMGLHFQLPHGMQLNTSTDVTPLGQIRYTAYASTYAYRGLGRGSNGASFTGSFFRNMVHGLVVDPRDEPIAGVALKIGGRLVVTDSDGKFLLRLKKPGDQTLEVSFEDFTAPGTYVLLQAPPSVKAVREDDAPEYKVILKRVPVAMAPADAASHPDDQPGTK